MKDSAAQSRLFDSYLVVDWSANGTPKTGADSLWFCLVRDGMAPLTENPATRHAAMVRLREIFAAEIQAGRRLLAGFDFPFGYPQGFGAALGGDWRTVWATLAGALADTPDNGNDRFDAAARLNAMFPGTGPFWGNGLKRDIDGLPRTRPTGYGNDLPSLNRHAEDHAKTAQEVWKLSGAGSVGGQALTGIAALERLRRDIDVAVWPFQTLGEGTLPVLAEVYPSLVPVPAMADRPKDAVQVEVTARAFALLDSAGQLAPMLAAPADLPVAVRQHEATILGLGHTDILAAAVAQAASDMAAPRRMRPYLKDPAAIYAESFATVRREARLDRFPPDLQPLAIRVIHACGMVEVADRLAFSADLGAAAGWALASGAPILCDCEMVAAGIIRRNLPLGTQVITTLNDPATPGLATSLETTRSAAAVDLWKPHLAGAIVVIGNAPTALFHLLERLDQGWPKPAAILGFPVGFVGAAESKAELAANPRGCAFVALRGRRGGSAMASAAVNALAAGLPEDTA